MSEPWSELSDSVRAVVISEIAVIALEKWSSLKKTELSVAVMHQAIAAAVRNASQSGSIVALGGAAGMEAMDPAIQGQVALGAIVAQAFDAAVEHLENTNAERSERTESTGGSWAELCSVLEIDAARATPEDVVEQVRRLKSREGGRAGALLE